MYPPISIDWMAEEPVVQPMKLTNTELPPAPHKCHHIAKV